MRTYVALFRGINVGGRNLLPMKDLVSLLEDLGAGDVRTYIQSGNAVFRHEERSAVKLAAKISSEIEKLRGFAPRVLLLQSSQFEAAIANNPFLAAAGQPKTLHLGFLASTPRNPDLDKLERLKQKGEGFHLKDRVFYLHLPSGVGRSKLAASAEKALGTPMTLRNWRTTSRILEMVDQLRA